MIANTQDSSSSERSEPLTTENAVFLKACNGLPTSHTPVWFMRQAGRYMSDYRAIRATRSMLECINTPEIAAEITLQPIDAFGFDAAIIFSDILPPLQSMGLDLEFVAGKGPVIHNPLSTTYQIDMLATPPAEDSMQGTLDAIQLVSQELTPRNIPLIGFCGAPFTMASYAIEGGGSKTYTKTKALMLNHPAAWVRLMDKLVTISADYLIKQAKSGASALQIFDSWAGLALNRYDYAERVLPFNKKLIEIVQKRVDCPVIYFSTGTAAYLDLIKELPATVIGVDWRTPLASAWETIGLDRPIQGNLDPAYLLAPQRERRFQIDRVLQDADGRPGHIFNLGHGIFKETDPSAVKDTVQYIHETTRRES